MKKKILLMAAVFLLYSGFCSSASYGQDTTAPSSVYSLYDLCKKALETSENIKIAENDLTIALEDKKRALSVLMPTATAFGSYLKRNNPDTNHTDLSSFGIKLTQSFTLNGKEIIALRITEDSIDQSEFSLQTVKDEYILQVANAYYQILRHQRYLDISKADVERLEKYKTAVNERLKVGEVTKTALYRAEAELSGAKTEFVRSENNLSLKRATLINLVEIDENFVLSEEHLSNFKDFSYSFEDLKLQAVENRSEIKTSQKLLDIAQKTLKYEKSAYWPTLSLEGAYIDSRAEYDEPVKGTDNSEDTFIEAVLTFTMFDGGLRNADIRQALARERKTRLAHESLKKNILLEAQQAWLYYQTAKSVLITLKDELLSAEENFNAVSMQFQYGMADSIDIMDANTLLVTAQRKLSDADYGLIMSILAVIRVRGDIVAVLTENR